MVWTDFEQPHRREYSAFGSFGFERSAYDEALRELALHWDPAVARFVWIQPGYVASGTFVSSVKDARPLAGTTPTWTTLSFAADTPAGTAIAFQVAASNSPAGPFTFVGPDRTANTFFTTSGADLSQFNGSRYLRYKAFLSTTDSLATPTLRSVTVCFRDQPT